MVTTPQSDGNRNAIGGFAVAASVAIHVVVVLALLALPARLFPKPDRPERVDIVFYEPEPFQPPEPPLVIPPPEEPAPAPIPEPTRVDVPPPTRPEPVAPPKRKPEPRRVEPPAPPAPRVAKREEPPRRKVQTDLFDATPEPPVKKAPPKRETRTVDFEADSRPAVAMRRSRTAEVGGFELAAAAEPTKPRETREVMGASFESAGNKKSERRPADRGSVKTNSFGDTVSGPRSGTRATGTVKQGQFGDTVATAATGRGRTRPAAKLDTPVEITDKPTPVYSDQARRLKIEGEVVLEVKFDAAGKLEVIRVINGLGHGLDEAAVSAARKIRFKPARRDGRPVDHTARIHIVFQLA